MRVSDKDYVNHNEMARIVLLGIRRERRAARGKSTKRLDNRVDQILAKAEARETGK
ncbi:hypothetical protein ABZ135_32715 [Streptomyces sp. NPDC006339]|uniref:hypothetical protein n=1 Tax=Streptomyces sp. NPDC006339 TaxID=3156755 RepID=UPI0033A7722C